MEKKFLNIILPGLGDSGGIHVIKKYAELLEDAGWDVVIYCPIKAYNLFRYKSKIKNVIHQVYCTIKTIFEIRKKPYYKWVWSISNTSVRNAHFTMATLWASAYDVAKLDETKGKKLYFIQDYEIWDNPELAKKSYLLPLYKIVISTWINNCLKKDLNIGPYPIVYNGLDTEIYHSSVSKVQKSDYVFLMLNHIQSKKGVCNGLKVFSEVKKKYPDCQLKMFGMCDDSNLPKNIEYYQNPTQEKIVELYSTADFFIFPSLVEGWGLTPLEAMACGCIVVGTKTGFVLDLGIHKGNMMISEPNDIKGMVKNIIDVIENNELATYIKNNARQTVEKLKWGNSVNRLIQILEDFEQM